MTVGCAGTRHRDHACEVITGGGWSSLASINGWDFQHRRLGSRDGCGISGDRRSWLRRGPRWAGVINELKYRQEENRRTGGKDGRGELEKRWRGKGGKEKTVHEEGGLNLTFALLQFGLGIVESEK